MALDFGLFYEIPLAPPWTPARERDAYHRVIAEEIGRAHV